MKLSTLPTLIGTDVAAERLGLTTVSVRRLVEEGQLKAHKVQCLHGRYRLVFDVDDVEQYLRQRIERAKGAA